MAIVAIKVIEVAAPCLSHSRIKNQPVLNNWIHAQDCCIKLLAHELVEHLVIPCLDIRNPLIGKKTMPIGTINQIAVYPREVVNSALKQHVRSMILGHNHPSGESKPSRADIAFTLDIEKAPMVMGITLHDHLIIADKKCVSLKSLSNLQRCCGISRS